MAFVIAAKSLSLSRRRQDVTLSSSRVSVERSMPSFLLEYQVKPKKGHELQFFTKAIAEVAQEVECSTIVDIGAGKGHLPRQLAFKYGLNVVTIEADGTHLEKATTIDRKVRSKLGKVTSHVSCKKDEHGLDHGKLYHMATTVSYGFHCYTFYEFPL